MKGSDLIEFSVIAGDLKGRKLSVPDLGITRPPLTRLRKAIFDFLKPYLDEASYLDLFSGTGSYLFEAVSRGAGKAVGIEKESRLADSINSNAAKLGVCDRLTCLSDDVFRAIPALSAREERFDIIMIAPPQYERLIDQTLVLLKENPLIGGDGLIVCQHASSETADLDLSGFELLQRRKYGNTTYTVLSG